MSILGHLANATLYTGIAKGRKERDAEWLAAVAAMIDEADKASKLEMQKPAQERDFDALIVKIDVLNELKTRMEATK